MFDNDGCNDWLSMMYRVSTFPPSCLAHLILDEDPAADHLWSMLSRHISICLDSWFPTGQAAWRRKGNANFHQWMCDVLRKVLLQDVPISSSLISANTIVRHSLCWQILGVKPQILEVVWWAQKTNAWSMLIFKGTHYVLMEKI